MTYFYVGPSMAKKVLSHARMQKKNANPLKLSIAFMQ